MGAAATKGILPGDENRVLGSYLYNRKWRPKDVNETMFFGVRWGNSSACGRLIRNFFRGEVNQL